MSKGSAAYTDVEPSNWIYKTPGDIQAELRDAYERNDQVWLKRQAWKFPSEYLAAADAIGVNMPWGSRLWLEKHAAEQRPTLRRHEAIDLTARQARAVELPSPCTTAGCYGFTATDINGRAGGSHWHVMIDGRDVGANPWPAEPPARPSQPPSSPPPLPSPAPLPPPRARCGDCGDYLPAHRQSPWCVRCNKVRLQAVQEAKPKVERPPVIYHCLACRTRIDNPGLGPRLCPRCCEERYVEQPSEDDGVLVRTTGTWPHLAFYTNRRGESVVKGRVLPHPRYGESRTDRLGDTPELDD